MTNKEIAQDEVTKIAKDKVTISLFSTEGGSAGYNQSMFNEGSVNELKAMKQGFEEAAQKANREPPEFVLSVLLIPDWNKEFNSYDHEDYLAAKRQFMQQTREVFGDIVTVHDFYEKAQLIAEEKQYLHGMGIPGKGGLGSCADMIKTHSIYDNKESRHLNIDCNTKIASYSEFYNATFGADVQQDLLNASYYDESYVSVHNKVVYTHPKGELAKELGEQLQEYCKEHKDDESDKLKNSVYAKAFTAATSKLTITRPVSLPNRNIHVADLTNPAFGLTKHVVTAINMSWAPSDGKNADIDYLKTIKPIKIDDAMIDFQAFQYIVKKYTNPMWTNSELGFSDESSPTVRDSLIGISNEARDIRYALQFYQKTLEQAPGKILGLANMIPETTDGDSFCQKVFNCTVVELKKRAKDYLADHPKEHLETIQERCKITKMKIENLNKRISSQPQLSEDEQKKAAEILKELEETLQKLNGECKNLEEKIQDLDKKSSVMPSEIIKNRLTDFKKREADNNLDGSNTLSI